MSDKVKRTSFHEYVNERTLDSEWDVVQAIRLTCIKQLGTVDIRHVKGHQTEKSADQPLPLSFKLNNEADKIATTFQDQTNHKDELVAYSHCWLDLRHTFKWTLCFPLVFRT
jgi:hypothetical protein